MSYWITPRSLENLEADYLLFLACHGEHFGTREDLEALIADLDGACHKLKRHEKSTAEGENLICGLTSARDLLDSLENLGPVTALEMVTDDYVHHFFIHRSRSSAYLWVCEEIARRKLARQVSQPVAANHSVAA